MSTFKFNTVALIVASAISPSTLFAIQNQDVEQPTKLSEIIVYGYQNLPLSSTKIIKQSDFKQLPNSNNNISDYLADHSSIRYEQSDKDGFTQGEIKPEAISINGADADQTAYLIDNVNINNDLALDNEVFDGAMQVIPGISHRQAYFFDANLLSSVAVHDKNISASLGGFMGGAVIAKTKQYNGQDRVGLRYRTTGSSWSKLKADEQAKSVLNQAIPVGTEAVFQPNYRKDAFSVSAEKRLKDNIGMVIGLSRRTSDITQYRIIGINGKTDKQSHTRNSDNALINFDWDINDIHRIELGLRYSNYREKKFYANNLNNNVLDFHKAYGTTLASVYAMPSGVLTNTLAYDIFQDYRKSNASSVEIVNVLNEDFDSIYDYEIGGYGNSALKQRNLHYSLEYAINPFYIGNLSHSISVGGLYQRTDYRFKRDQDIYLLYRSEYLDGSDTLEMPKELFAKQGKVGSRYQNIAFYVEDLMKIGQFELRPGVRLERDDYLKNTNLAPRFTIQFTPIINTQLRLGLNRYYGRSFSALKLSDKILALNGSPNERYQNIQMLKTPYNDEITFGATKSVSNWQIQANYTYRKNKQRITVYKEKIGEKPNGDPLYQQYYKNGKPYGVGIYTLEINNLEPWKLGITEWQTGLAFDWINTQRINIEDPSTLIYLNGKQTTKAEMEKKVNSKREDWIARFTINMAIPNYNLNWSNKILVKAPIKQYEQLENDINGLSAYYSYNYGKHTQWDTSIRWQPKLFLKYNPYIKIDVLNVLNNTRKIRSYTSNFNSNEYGIYTAGRQFWLELGYDF